MASVIPQEVKQTVAFLFQQMQTEEGTLVNPVGTGFFVGLPQENAHFIYFVTAKHVVIGQKEVLLRMNTKNYESSAGQSGIRYIRVSVKDEQDRFLWAVHSNPAVDVAVLPYAPDPTSLEFKIIGPEMFATKDILAKERVGEGDEIFYTGLLPQFYKTRRNYPVVRYGRIALLTDELIESPEGSQELYFAECQTFPGNSGSPVFLRFGPTRIPGRIVVGGERLFLLGLMKGFFYEEQPVEIQETKRFLLSSRQNIGIAAIIPVDKLKDILFSPDLVRSREQQLVK